MHGDFLWLEDKKLLLWSAHHSFIEVASDFLWGHPCSAFPPCLDEPPFLGQIHRQLGLKTNRRKWNETKQLESSNKYNKSINTRIASWPCSALCSLPVVTLSMILPCCRPSSPATPALWSQEPTFTQFKALSYGPNHLTLSSKDICGSLWMEVSCWCPCGQRAIRLLYGHQLRSCNAELELA